MDEFILVNTEPQRIKFFMAYSKSLSLLWFFWTNNCAGVDYFLDPKQTVEINQYEAGISNVSMLNHNAPRRRSQHLKTTTLIHLRSQRRLKRRLPNMHGRHPAPVTGWIVIIILQKFQAYY